MRKLAFICAAPGLLGLLAACGDPYAAGAGVELMAPELREAKISLTPALDVSGSDQAFLDRVVIDDIRLNLADVRLLGADPTIPAGGLPLSSGEQVVEAFGDRAGIDLPFPRRFVGDDSLAVYLRIDKSSALAGASVVVRARLYREELTGGESKSLQLDPTGATDPDGDPANDPNRDIVEATDPDGDPARPKDGACDGATDPDGDPAQPGCIRSGLVTRAEYQPYVEVEFRDDDSADLVATLASPDATDVVVGIPASRWLTSEVIAQLEAAFDAPEVAPTSPRGERVPGSEGAIIVQRTAPAETADTVDETSDYFLSDAENLERLRVRR